MQATCMRMPRAYAAILKDMNSACEGEYVWSWGSLCFVMEEKHKSYSRVFFEIDGVLDTESDELIATLKAKIFRSQMLQNQDPKQIKTEVMEIFKEAKSAYWKLDNPMGEAYFTLLLVIKRHLDLHLENKKMEATIELFDNIIENERF